MEEIADASAVDDPEMPANTMLATTAAWASPARRWPTSTRENSTGCWLMPPADISAPARMK